jgi:hypothetical protein
MVLAISHKATFWIDHEIIYLLTDHGSTLHRRCKICHHDTFSEVLLVSSECMVMREELPMFVERRILATLLQPNEPKTFLVYWAWEPPVNIPGAEYPIGQQVMH